MPHFTPFGTTGIFFFSRSAAAPSSCFQHRQGPLRRHPHVQLPGLHPEAGAAACGGGLRLRAPFRRLVAAEYRSARSRNAVAVAVAVAVAAADKSVTTVAATYVRTTFRGRNHCKFQGITRTRRDPGRRGFSRCRAVTDGTRVGGDGPQGSSAHHWGRIFAATVTVTASSQRWSLLPPAVHRMPTPTTRSYEPPLHQTHDNPTRPASSRPCAWRATAHTHPPPVRRFLSGALSVVVSTEPLPQFSPTFLPFPLFHSPSLSLVALSVGTSQCNTSASRRPSWAWTSSVRPSPVRAYARARRTSHTRPHEK